MAGIPPLQGITRAQKVDAMGKWEPPRAGWSQLPLGEIPSDTSLTLQVLNKGFGCEFKWMTGVTPRALGTGVSVK